MDAVCVCVFDAAADAAAAADVIYTCVAYMDMYEWRSLCQIKRKNTEQRRERERESKKKIIMVAEKKGPKARRRIENINTVNIICLLDD